MMMMGQSQNQNQNQRGSSASTSRLSASAKPFTMNSPKPISKFSSFAPGAFDPSLDLWQPISSSVSGLEQLSLLNLEEDDPTVAAYDCHGYSSAVPFDLLQEVGPEPCYPQYITEGFQDHNDIDMGFDVLTVSKISHPIRVPNQMVDKQGSFCRIEENDNGLIPKQGKALVAEELNSRRESSDSMQRKCSNLTEKHNQTTLGGTEQIDDKGLSLPVNELTPSKFSASSYINSSTTLNDLNQSQVSYREPVLRWSNFTLAGSSSKGSFSHIDSYSVKTTVPHSSPSATSSSKTLAFSVTNNQNSPGYKASSLNELSFIPSAESKGKEKVTCDDFGLKHQGIEVNDPVQNSSRLFDVNDADLDLDSPCWKGTRNSIRSPFEVSQPVNLHHGENEVEAHNSLNPMAPHFFPSHGKSSVSQTTFMENDISSLQKRQMSAENLLSRENKLTDSYPLENELFNISNFGSVFNSSHMAQPYLVEDYFASKDKVSSEEPVASSLKEDATQVSTLVSFTAAECVPGSSLSGARTSQDVPNSLYRSTGIDGHMVVNAMSDLSELLVQRFSNDLGSLDELDRDAIRHTINNLYLCIQNSDGHRPLLPKSTRPQISCSLEKSTELQKLSNMEAQVTRTKAVTFSHGKDNENYEQQALGSCSRYGVEEGDQIISKVIKKVHKGDPLKEEAHPQTTLYRNLWLDAEAALCAMKYKARLFHMKAETEHR